MIFFESIAFLLLGIYTWGNDVRFLKLLMILCFVDAFWIFAMLPHYLKKQRPEPLPWAWGILNLAGGVYLVATIYAGLPISFASTASYAILVLWFFASFILDVVLIDHYRPLHKLDSEDENTKINLPKQTKLTNRTQ